MRTTRAQAYASHCVITRVPVEIVTQILKYDGLSRRDHAAVAKTCRYLRAIATPLLFQSILIVADKKTSFAPLEAIAGSPEKGALVRTITIDEPDKAIASNRATIYAGILVSALNVLSSLTSVSIPSALLSLAAFDAIYGSDSIKKLTISRLLSSEVDPAFSRRTPSLTARKTVLAFPWLSHVIRTAPASPSASTAGIANMLDFLDFHGVAVEQVMLNAFHPESTFGTFLTARPFASLVLLSVDCNLRTFHKTTNWITTVLSAQSALETLQFEVSHFLGFAINRDSWASWFDGELLFPLPDLVVAWSGVQVRSLMISAYRHESDGNFIPTHVELTLPKRAEVSPRRVRALVEHEPCAFAFSFLADTLFYRSGLDWPDWTATVDAFLAHEYLSDLNLHTSVTLTPTVFNTIACSSACYATLLETHPALHAATELVGGPAALWTLAVDLNIERLRLLENTLQSQVIDIDWTIFGREGSILVDYEASIGEQSFGPVKTDEPKKLKFVNKATPRPVEETLLNCVCFVCGSLRGLEDPITSIRRCGVDEVRAALAIGGFDPDAFDKRSPTNPVDPGSFETFLRSKP